MITYTEDTAYIQAAKADQMFSEVRCRSLLCSLSFVASGGCQSLSLVRSQTATCDQHHDLPAAMQGTDLGPLQGIPYGLKDLISVGGYRTTWGAPAYMDQMLDTDAYVYKR